MPEVCVILHYTNALPYPSKLGGEWIKGEISVSICWKANIAK